MAKFEFKASLIRKDGTEEEGARFTLEHLDYEGHNETTATTYLLDNKALYGYRRDTVDNMMYLGGAGIPLEDFARVRVELIAKAVG